VQTHRSGSSSPRRANHVEKYSSVQKGSPVAHPGVRRPQPTPPIYICAILVLAVRIPWTDGYSDASSIQKGIHCLPTPTRALRAAARANNPKEPCSLAPSMRQGPFSPRRSRGHPRQINVHNGRNPACVSAASECAFLSAAGRLHGRLGAIFLAPGSLLGAPSVVSFRSWMGIQSQRQDSQALMMCLRSRTSFGITPAMSKQLHGSNRAACRAIVCRYVRGARRVGSRV